MAVLALDTTTAVLTLGITDFNTLERYQTWEIGREISQYLHQHLATFLQPLSWSDLEWLVVAQGPGSFTGTRMGVVTGRLLAQHLQIPLFGISNLAALAYAYATTVSKIHVGDRIAVEIPGQRGSVYGGLFIWDAHQQTLTYPQPIGCFPSQEWQQILVREPIQHHITPTSSSINPQQICQALIALGHQQWLAGGRSSWEAVLPYYGTQAAYAGKSQG
ncbi:MAG: tRNA (adenosine(37)-N6)-threonylcarbamoyltransferase complex dimerization subunit type 1 TsaB [Acaryochloridaceae cyanobacterium CSU_3_4]|nr:tRNA (adenosine(37)-N6)-threonylcarbamoyltransferase complex dimerization subunit type 1 TsaB [Acaryochloridaceae cyanobacterium CSU_3_4]